MKNWKKTYFTILAGHGLSDITSSVLQFAIIWYIEKRTSSPFALSMAMTVGFFAKGIAGHIYRRNN